MANKYAQKEIKLYKGRIAEVLKKPVQDRDSSDLWFFYDSVGALREQRHGRDRKFNRTMNRARNSLAECMKQGLIF